MTPEQRAAAIRARNARLQRERRANGSCLNKLAHRTQQRNHAKQKRQAQKAADMAARARGAAHAESSSEGAAQTSNAAEPSSASAGSLVAHPGPRKRGRPAGRLPPSLSGAARTARGTSAKPVSDISHEHEGKTRARKGTAPPGRSKQRK